MNSNLSSFTDQWHPSDFDENIPFKEHEESIEQIVETEKEFDSTITSQRNDNQILTSRIEHEEVKVHSGIDFYGQRAHSKLKKRKHEDIKYLNDSKPFTYKRESGFSYRKPSEATSKLLESKRESEEVNKIVFKGYGQVLPEESSWMSIANEDWAYFDEEITEKSFISRNSNKLEQEKPEKKEQEI